MQPAISRRRFLHAAAVAVASGLSDAAFAAGREALPSCRVAALTSSPRHHFFGYYGIPPWNKSGRRLVCLESSFQDHFPTAEEAASVGLVDAETGVFTKLAETRAWNLQQGAMLHWNPLQPETEVIFNDRKDGEIVSAILDVLSGRKRFLPRAVSAVSHKGKLALSLTYGRLTRMRRVVGYAGASDPNPDSPHPANDGVFLMDLATGKNKLVVSIDEVYGRLAPKYPEIGGRHMWFNHTVFNKDDTRFFFLARTWTPEPSRRLESAMFTANLDGSDLREVVPFGRGVSHFEWRNAREILATFRFGGEAMKHVLFTDGRQDYRAIGEELLSRDGHCSFAPDQDWIVTDQGDSQARSKSLVIYNVKAKRGLVLGTFPMKDYYTGDLRCDLHPRWNRTGDAICFDALETTNWTRQIHIARLTFTG